MGRCTISEVAAEAGVSPDTPRYYERIGLVREPERTAAGYRTYGTDVVGRLRFIKGAQRMGLRLREINQLLEIRDHGACPCGHARALLAQRMHKIEAEIDRLNEVRHELVRMVAGLDSCPAPRAGVW